MKKQYSAHKSQQGLGMIEVLISVLVLALGLTAYLQLTQNSLKNADSAYFRGQSAVLVADIIDRIRVNSSDAISGRYNIAYTASTPSGSSQSDTDINLWRTNITNIFPQGNGAIDCAASTQVCTVSIRWDDSRAVAGSNQQELTMLAVIR